MLEGHYLWGIVTSGLMCQLRSGALRWLSHLHYLLV